MKNTLEFLMVSNNLNKSQLAKNLGITRQTVIRIMKGNPPSMEVGLKIANYFKKDVSEIFFANNVKQVAHQSNSKTA